MFPQRVKVCGNGSIYQKKCAVPGSPRRGARQRYLFLDCLTLCHGGSDLGVLGDGAKVGGGEEDRRVRLDFRHSELQHEFPIFVMHPGNHHRLVPWDDVDHAVVASPTPRLIFWLVLETPSFMAYFPTRISVRTLENDSIAAAKRHLLVLAEQASGDDSA